MSAKGIYQASQLSNRLYWNTANLAQQAGDKCASLLQQVPTRRSSQILRDTRIGALNGLRMAMKYSQQPTVDLLLPSGLLAAGQATLPLRLARLPFPFFGTVAPCLIVPLSAVLIGTGVAASRDASLSRSGPIQLLQSLLHYGLFGLPQAVAVAAARACEQHNLLFAANACWLGAALLGLALEPLRVALTAFVMVGVPLPYIALLTVGSALFGFGNAVCRPHSDPRSYQLAMAEISAAAQQRHNVARDAASLAATMQPVLQQGNQADTLQALLALQACAAPLAQQTDALLAQFRRSSSELSVDEPPDGLALQQASQTLLGADDALQTRGQKRADKTRFLQGPALLDLPEPAQALARSYCALLAAIDDAVATWQPFSCSAGEQPSCARPASAAKIV